jgi:phospholipid N-methyltransferase
MKHTLSFMREFRKNYYLTGSLVPSSKFLGQALCKTVKARKGRKSVIEIGPGTGAVTSHIIDCLCPGDRLVLVEASENFCEILARKASTEWKDKLNGVDFSIQCCFVQEVEDSNEFDIAISGLPLNNFPTEVVRSILKSYKRLLKPDGCLSYFEYLWIRKIRAGLSAYRGKYNRLRTSRVLDRFLEETHNEQQVVFVNFPPAIARHICFHS